MSKYFVIKRDECCGCYGYSQSKYCMRCEGKGYIETYVDMTELMVRKCRVGELGPYEINEPLCENLI